MPLKLQPIQPFEFKRLTCGDPQFRHQEVKDFVHWRLYLHHNQTYLYRSYVWLLHEHTDLQQRCQLNRLQEAELAAIAWFFHKALAKLSQPDMINEYFAGNEYYTHRGHAHLHLIPRYYQAPTFNGQLFPDARFGKNHAPYKTCDIPFEVFEAIRESLRVAIEQASTGP